MNTNKKDIYFKIQILLMLFLLILSILILTVGRQKSTGIMYHDLETDCWSTRPIDSFYEGIPGLYSGLEDVSMNYMDTLK